MKIDSAEAMHELEQECECAREALAAMQAQRDLARDCAAALEAENAALRVLLAERLRLSLIGQYLPEIVPALNDFAETGTLSADALALASRLSGGEG